MPLETPTPDELLELFRDEIVPREAESDDAIVALVKAHGSSIWNQPFPGVELLQTAGGPLLMRVTYRRQLDGSFDEKDRIRHELRQLWNDIRAAIPSTAQVEFLAPRMTHVDRPDGLVLNCQTCGIVRVH